MCTHAHEACYGQAVQRVHHLCKEGLVQEALQTMDSLGIQCMHVPEAAWVSILQNCIRENDLLAATQLHAMLSKYKRPWSSKLSCKLIHMFAACGSLPEALQVFQNMVEKNVYAWTTIISAYAQAGHPEHALMLYKQMKTSTTDPSSNTTVAALKACVCMRELQEGMMIHDYALKQDLEANLFVGSALVDMYAKCGSLQEAFNVFEKLAERDVVSWCTMIAAFTQHGRGVEALMLYNKMQEEGTQPNLTTLVCLLKACAVSMAINEGKVFYNQIVNLGFELDMFTGNTLISMYINFCCTGDARKVFDKMPKRDVVSWNAMLAGYVSEHADCVSAEESLSLYKKMQEEERQPDNVTFFSVLKACAISGRSEEGELMHTDLTYRGLDIDFWVLSTLIDMYTKCGRLDSAWLLFERSPRRDVVLWSAMISGYAQHGPEEKALELYKVMRGAGIQPDKITIMWITKACAKLMSPTLARWVHADVVFEGMDMDSVLISTVCDLYFKCGSYPEAQKIFDGLPLQNAVSFNLLLAGYGDQEHAHKAFDYFEKMREVGIEPDEVSFACVMKACSNLSALDQGKKIHGMLLEKGFDSNIILGNALVDMYAKCQRLDDALYMSEKLPVCNVISWSALIGGFSECGRLHEAVCHYDSMKDDGIVPNEVTFISILKGCASQAALKRGMQIHTEITKQGCNSDKLVENGLIDMYAKCGSLDEARMLFDELSCKTVISYTSLLAGLTENECGEKALHVFYTLEEEGIHPNEITYVCILKACGSLAALDHGKRIHAGIVRRKMDATPSIGNTLVGMYSKCGCMDIAQDMFRKLSARDVVSWNVMIGGYADHGYHELAECCFKRMQQEGIRPDGITFVTLLTACSHAGLVPESYYYYDLMIDRYRLSSAVEHHVCMIDVLGRAGQFVDAEEFACRVPSSSSAAVWAALLGACAKLEKNLEFGKRAFENLIKADRSNIMGYVLMSNILAANHVGYDE